MEETRGTRINAERTRQALDTGADDGRHGLPVLHDDVQGRLAADEAETDGVKTIDIAELLAGWAIPSAVASGSGGRRALPVLQ